jgi:hypothetical protein
MACDFYENRNRHLILIQDRLYMILLERLAKYMMPFVQIAKMVLSEV